MKRTAAFLWAFALLTSQGLWAHDFWIEPKTLFPQAGTRLDVSLCIGHHHEVEFYARNPRHAAEFHLVAVDGTKTAVDGEAGAQPAGYLERVPEGPAWLVYRSNFSPSELEPARFEAYLREEGLEHVIADRAAKGESQMPGRERYARAAKALIVASPSSAAAVPSVPVPAPPLGPVGLPAELLLGDNPLAPPGSDDAHLPMRILVRGKPFEGGLVSLESLDPTAETPKVHQVRTDADGVAKLPWPGPGRWLATAVHMERAEGETDFEWRTQFLSVRFDVQGAVPESGATAGGDRGSVGDGQTGS